MLARIRTCESLTAAGIPCTVVLDSAVAYVMDKVDIVLVGSEAVVESGGLINAVGSNQMAIIAKAANKPFYAMAERYAITVGLLRQPSRSRLLSARLAATSFIASFHSHSTTCRRTRLRSFPSPERRRAHPYYHQASRALPYCRRRPDRLHPCESRAILQQFLKRRLRQQGYS